MSDDRDFTGAERYAVEAASVRESFLRAHRGEILQAAVITPRQMGLRRYFDPGEIGVTTDCPGGW